MPNIERDFQENGYLFLKDFIDKESIKKLIERMHSLVAQESDGPANYFVSGQEKAFSNNYFLESAHNISFFCDKSAPNDAPLLSRLNKIGHALHEKDAIYKAFSYQPRLFALMQRLGQRQPKIIQSMFIFKQPLFGEEVLPHQDSTFLYTKPHSTIGIWFALQDSNEENGCLHVLKKGHKNPLKSTFCIDDTNKSYFVEESKVSWPLEQFTPIPAQAGDAIILHGLLPHFSKKNLSQKTRFALTLHFIDDNAFFPPSNWIREAA